MGLGVTNNEQYIELSIPLHDDIDSLSGHLRVLANNLEAIKNQGLIEEIGVSKYSNYFSLNVLIRKSGDFSLLEFEKALK